MDKSGNKIKKEETKKVSEETENLIKRIEELENQNKRLLADYRNLEQRVDSQRRDWILEANKKLLLNLLPVLDTLIVAEKHSKSDQSLSLSLKQFLDILRLEGVEKIETEGKIFDPNLMECIQTVEGQEGKVIEETRAGYKLYDRVLRPAQVRVGSAGQNAKQNHEKGN